MIAHGSAFPVAKLALNNSVPPILMASLRMGLVFLLLIPFCKFKLPNKKAFYRLFEQGNNFINIEVERATTEHKNRMIKYAKNIENKVGFMADVKNELEILCDFMKYKNNYKFVFEIIFNNRSIQI